MLADLILPLECGGCGTPGVRWCATCARQLLLRADEPTLVSPRVDPGVPVFALGRYAGPRREAIVAAKERGRGDLIAPLGAVLRTGIDRLLAWEVLPVPLTLVPAPTRAAAARRRGGDPVARMARAAERSGVTVAEILRLRAFTRDSVGLAAAARQRNVAGRVRVRRGVGGVTGPCVVVDDVVTTGATVAESVRVLDGVGADVVAVVVLATA